MWAQHQHQLVGHPRMDFGIFALLDCDWIGDILQQTDAATPMASSSSPGGAPLQLRV
ncbi:MAG: hypothetical protein HC851_04665 [Acaryochloris sp. RU_4_1]|nr:hypothetical protein [Acaryochloris sp. RU_4_1]